MDENKVETLTWETISFTPLKYDPNPDKSLITQSYTDRRIKEKQARQEQQRKESQARKMQELDAQSDDLFQNSLDATDVKVKKQYTSASRISDVAGVIRDYAMEKGIDLSSANDNDVITAFMQSNPNKANGINDYLNGKTDLYTAASNIWFVKPVQQETTQEWGVFTDIVGWAYDSVTSIPRMIGKWAANAIWWVAKQFWADDDKVNELVNNYKNYLDEEWSWESIGADTDSATYSIAKWVWDLAQVAWWEWLLRWAVKGSQALNAVSKAIGGASLPVRAWAAALEWAADTAAYSLIADNEMPSVWETVAGAALGAAFPLAWAWLKAAKKIGWGMLGTAAEKQIMKMNTLSKWVKQAFEKKYWVNYWKFLNDRWIVGGMEETIDWLGKYMKNNKDRVDAWLAAIEWTFGKNNKNLHEMADAVAEYAADVSIDPVEVSKYRKLAEKAKTEWLTMSEINDVKRYYERNNKFTYGRDTSQWWTKASKRATELDNAVRERQIEEAAKNWFWNLRELNKETAASKELLDAFWKELRWTYWNDYFWLSDYIILAWGDAKAIAWFLVKKWLNSDVALKYWAKLANRLTKHKNLEQWIIDFEAISKINSEKELEKLLQSDYNMLKLPQKEVTVQDLPEYTMWWIDWGNTRIRQWTVLDRE